MSLFRLPSEFIPQTQSSLFLASIWKRYSVYLKKLLSFKESGCCNLRFNTSYRLKFPKTKWVSKDPWRQSFCLCWPLTVGHSSVGYQWCLGCSGYWAFSKDFFFRMPFAQWANSCTEQRDCSVFYFFKFTEYTICYLLAFVSFYYRAIEYLCS